MRYGCTRLTPLLIPFASLLLLLSLAFCVACGVKGPPLPPLSGPPELETQQPTVRGASPTPVPATPSKKSKQAS